jgi:hypothetical protein
MGIVSAVYSQTEILQKEARALRTRCCAHACETAAHAHASVCPQVFLVERLDVPAGEPMLHIKVRVLCAFGIDAPSKTASAGPCRGCVTNAAYVYG